MTILGYIGALVLLFVVLPVVVFLLRGVLLAARSIPATIDAIATVGTAASRDLDAVQLLLTTSAGVQAIITVVADLGRSLDIILEDV
jgi:hypothetical protein